MAAVVERWNPHARVRQDLFGFADVIAVVDGAVLLVQATTGKNVSARLAKLRAEPCRSRVRRWLLAGGRVQIHGWAKRGPRGKRKLWTCSVREIVLEDVR